MITVDGRTVELRGTLLDACHDAGAVVPALCRGEGLSVGGHCRSCLVDRDGQHVAACTTPATDGAVVRTDTPALRAYRLDLGELMLAECEPAGVAREAVARWGAEGARYERSSRAAVRDHTHAHVRIDLDRCILCRRCVRACEEIEGEFVLAIEGRGAASRLAWGGGPFEASACVACGACVSECPAEALTSRDTAPHFRDVRVTRTACAACGALCAIDVHVTDGPDERVSHIEGVRGAPPSRGHLCATGRYAHGFVRHGERLVRPLVRCAGRLEPVSWSEALARVAEGFARHHGAAGAVASAGASTEELYLLQKFVRGVLGTHHVDVPGTGGASAAYAGRSAVFGTPSAVAALEAIEDADLLFVAGSDLDEAQPVTAARVRRAALAGATLIVIDPRRTELAGIADAHLAVRAGADVPLLHSLACALVSEGLVDAAKLAADTPGWAEFEAFVRRHTPERWEAATGVPAIEVRRVARRLARVRRPWFAHGDGFVRPPQGSEKVQLLGTLAVLVGASGSGLAPLFAPPNPGGAIEAGAVMGHLPRGHALDDPAAREALAQAWGRPLPALPEHPWRTPLDCVRSRDLRAMFVLAEDLLAGDVDDRARAALESLELLVVAERFLTPTAAIAHVVLPVASRLEKDGTFLSSEGRHVLVHRALDPPGEARDDLRVLLELFAAGGWAQTHADAHSVMGELTRLAPGDGGPAAPAFACVDWENGRAPHPS